MAEGEEGVSFLEKMDDWHDLRPDGQTLIFNGLLCNYWPEIRAVIGAVEKQRRHSSGLPCEEVENLYASLEALDKKADE